MADEPNTPNHRWYQRRYNISLAKEDVSRDTIFASGIAKIDAYIASLPGGSPITATVAPSAYAYSDGGTVGDHPSFATLDNTGNYSSTAGTITSVEWLVDGVDQASSFTLSAGESVVVRVTDSAANTRDWTIDASVDATVPAQFNTNQWSLSNDGVNVTLTVSALPDDGGSALTDLEYSVNGGGYTSLGAATTGDYTITASEGDSVTLRAVNAVGNGTASASKTVPASGAQLDLDFASGTYADNASNTALSSIVTFARSKSATYVDSSGVIQTASSGTIRDAHHEWNGSSWVRKGLLLETDAATNLITYSETIESGTGQWSTATGSAATVQDATAAPDGNTQGVKLNETSVTDEFFIFSSPFAASASNICGSIYMKAGERGFGVVQVYVDGGTRHAICVNLSTGAITDTDSTGSPSIVSTGVDDAGNGWYRVWVSLTHTIGLISLIVMPSDSATPTWVSSSARYAGTAGSGIYIWGAQLEAGSFPSSYIPTSGATATRAGETLSVNAAGVPWSTTAMSWVFEGEASWIDSGSTSEAILFGSYVDASNNLNLAISGSGADTGKLLATTETAATVETADGPSNTAAGYRNAVSAGLRHTTTDLQAVDGGTSGTNQTAVGGSIYDYGTNTKALYIGGDNNAWAYNGTIQRLRMWDSDVGASSLETETT